MDESQQNETLIALEEYTAWTLLHTVTQFLFRSMSSCKWCPLVCEFLRDTSLERKNKNVASLSESYIYGREALFDLPLLIPNKSSVSAISST